MKKVIKKASPIPKPLQNCDKKIEKALEEKGKHDFSGYYYASDSVKKRLSTIYRNTCAFCETDTTAGAVLQVEHYRPKAKVSDDELHEGYYWLGYEWTNLLYACSSCNRAKSTFFPIDEKGLRVYNPPLNGTSLDKIKCKSNHSDLANEKPLILNPEEHDFNPELHFLISPLGKIKEISKRGEKTIQICKLNRKSLSISRKKIVDEHFRFLMKAFEKHKDKLINRDNLIGRIEVEIERILDRVNDNKPYTLLAKYMLKHFDYFFTQRFQQPEQEVLNEVYNNVFSTSQID